MIKDDLLAIALLTVPAVIFMVITARQYTFSISPGSGYWSWGKRLALLLWVLLLLWIGIAGNEALHVGGRRWFEFFLMTGLGFALALFPKAASGLFDNHLELMKTGMDADYGVVIGWLLLLAAAFWLLLLQLAYL